MLLAKLLASRQGHVHVRLDAVIASSLRRRLTLRRTLRTLRRTLRRTLHPHHCVRHASRKDPQRTRRRLDTHVRVLPVGEEGRFVGEEGRFVGLEGRFVGLKGRFVGLEGTTRTEEQAAIGMSRARRPRLPRTHIIDGAELLRIMDVQDCTRARRTTGEWR